jgi:hypothetical protein
MLFFFSSRGTNSLSYHTSGMSKALALLLCASPAVSGFVAPCVTPAGCIVQTAQASPAVRPATAALRAEKGGGMFGGLFGKGDKKKESEFEDVEDAVEDWKEIGFDIDEVIKAEEDAKKEKK